MWMNHWILRMTSSNKRRTGATALIRRRRLSTFLPRMRRLFAAGGAHSSSTVLQLPLSFELVYHILPSPGLWHFVGFTIDSWEGDARWQRRVLLLAAPAFCPFHSTFGRVNRWWLLWLTVKSLANLRLTVAIIPLLSPKIFLWLTFFYDYRSKFVNFYS